MPKTIYQRSLDPGIFTNTPNLAGLIRYEVINGANNGSDDEVTTLQDIVNQANANGVIVARIQFNDRGEYDPSLTTANGYERDDLVRSQGTTYFRLSNVPPVLAGTLNGGAALTDDTQWGILVEGGGTSRSSDRITLTASQGLIATSPEVIKFVPDADNYEITLPPIASGEYKEFILFNNTNFLIRILDENSVFQETFAASIGYERVECFWILDEWQIVVKEK